MAAFEIRWQQCENAVIPDTSVEIFKPFHKYPAIQVLAFQVVTTVTRSRGATAFKHAFRIKYSGHNSMGLEKAHRQKRNLLQCSNSRRVDPQHIHVIPVKDIVLILEPEDFKRKFKKACHSR